MSKRKNSGAGTPVPAPRGAQDPQAMAAVAADLRAAAREAREALGDLVRERKAVEQLAQQRAEDVIVAHVDGCLKELTEHLDRQNVKIMTDLTAFHKAHLAKLLREWADIDLVDLTDAVQTLAWLKREAERIQTEGDTDGTG